jgi:hypothetical protein
MTIKPLVIELYQNQLFSSDHSPFKDASDEVIDSFQQRNDMWVPPDLKEWLKYSNGSFTGPGGLYGLGNGIEHLNIETYYSYYPRWKQKKWIPISGDGTGNSYIVDANKDSSTYGAVFFIDTTENPNEISYVVASDLWHFLFFLMKNEDAQTGWPFSREYVISVDKKLETIDGALLPWNI